MNRQYPLVVKFVQDALNIEEKDAKGLIQKLNFAKIVELNSAVAAENMDAVKSIFGIQEAFGGFSQHSAHSGSDNSFTAAKSKIGQQGRVGEITKGDEITHSQDLKKGDAVTIQTADGTEVSAEIADSGQYGGDVKIKTDKGTEKINLYKGNQEGVKFFKEDEDAELEEELSKLKGLAGIDETTSAGGVAVAVAPTNTRKKSANGNARSK